MKENPRMAFLAHWVENWNWLLWWSKKLHCQPEKSWHWVWLWPVYTLMSIVYLVGRKPFNIVDRFEFKTVGEKKIAGITALLRNFGWHFFLPMYQDKIRQRILSAVLVLQDYVSVIGLGALVKDERLTQGGRWIVEQLGDRLRVSIVHGDTLTAATVLRQTLAILKKYRIKSPVFLTGSTSKIGRAVAIGLARRGIRVVMQTQSCSRFQCIAEEAGEFAVNLRHAEFLSEGSECALWITGKSVPSGKDLRRHIPKGAVVLNFAVPNPLSRHDFKKRPDLHSYEGGLLAYNPERTDLHFTMRLRPGLTYACHAGTFVHAYCGWKNHEVGPVEISRLDEVWRWAEEIGFFLPPI